MDSIYDFWISLHKDGWKLPEIDSMDIVFYLRMLRYANTEKKEKLTPIDEIGFM